MRHLCFMSPGLSAPTFALCEQVASNMKKMLNTPILISCSPKYESYIYSAFSPSCSNENFQVNLALFILTVASTPGVPYHLLN